MDEAKENVDYSAQQHRNNPQQKVGRQKGLKSQQQEGGRSAGDSLKNNRPKKRDLGSTLDQQQKVQEQQKQMETAKQQNDNTGIYPTIQPGNDEQHAGQNAIRGGGEGGHGQIHQQMGGKNSSPGKDRQQEATELAKNASLKHAKYYVGTLHSLGGTFPVRKSVSTFNRIKGSNESTEQTLNRWIQGLHTIDFGISFLIWRIFFLTKDFSADIYDKAGKKWNGLVRMLANSSLPMTILLSFGLVIFSPIIFGSLFFIIPATLFMLAFLLIPALFVVPTVLFFIFVFNLLPFPNKRAGTFAKNSFGRIPIFNKSQKTEGKEGEEMRTTMAYQKTH